jgi:hypothetical protein
VITEEAYLSAITNARLHRDGAADLLQILYWTAVEMGWHRRFHGVNYSTPVLHTWRWGLVDSTDPAEHALGTGYRAALAGETR